MQNPVSQDKAGRPFVESVHGIRYQVRDVAPRTPGGCEECLRSGSRWVHLRTCQECGTTRCCDNSPNRHATKHHHATQHPIVRSFEPGERWRWCFVDEAIV